MKVKQYTIKCSALGYDTTHTLVYAETKEQAKASVDGAIEFWCRENDVDLASGKLASVKITLSSQN
jgi:hypothetical protein